MPRIPFLAAAVLSWLPAAAQTLPGTEPLTATGDLARQMIDGLDRFVTRELALSVERRQTLWKRDFTSREAYERSVAPNRERFRKIFGVVDARVPFESPALEATVARPALLAEAPSYRVFAVRWPALPGVDGEGLLLEPRGVPAARVVALPDAGWTPEMLAGLTPGVPPAAQFARRLAENGCLVLVPVLIDRNDTWSGSPRFGPTKGQSHREFIYRMAFETGRHLIGYEVQKVLAAVDWFVQAKPPAPVGVFGYGEGALVALASAAADTRIDAAALSGYFQSRQEVWREPLYRNVWGLLSEFGDAELAGLVAPRALVIESARGPEVPDPPSAPGVARGLTPGRLVSPRLEDTRREAGRARPVFERLGMGARLSLVETQDGRGDPGSDPALASFLRALGVRPGLRAPGALPKVLRAGFDASPRMRRQFEQLIDFTQVLVRNAPFVRQKFWARADASSIEKWQQTTGWYRRYFWEEVMGKLPSPTEPMNARTRLAYDRPRWKGYEVVLPVWPDVIAYGILLLPKNLKPGERRPVVVCQHGNEGRPQSTIDTDPRRRRPWAAELADRGFIVYLPQNPYIFQDAFRRLVRKGNPIKLSLFSFIIGQHERTLEWLSQQPFVDPARIAFYGISYGGKTAVRVPPVLEKYCLSICSADFNEYAWKMTSLDMPSSFMLTREYEMYEFDLANTFNYADLANLMAPRPFMVERGHKDTVSIDEWVAYEYAKVRRFYTFLGIPDRTGIEFFNGPHTINGVGTYQFLHRHLNWPEP